MYDSRFDRGDRRKNFIALGVIFVAVIGIVIFASGVLDPRGIVSPVPDENTVRIIFVTPEPLETASPSAAVAGESDEKKEDN